MNKEFINSIKDRVTLEDMLRHYSCRPSRESATDHRKWFCFGHPDSKPSLAVYKDGHYYCYSCGRNGDIFSLVMEMEHLDFSESVERICDMYSIEIPKDDDAGPSLMKQYTDVIRDLHQQFQKCMYKYDGYSEWMKRGFTREFIDEYQLGIYRTPDKHGTMLSYLKGKYGDLPYQDWGIVNDKGDFVLQNRLLIPIKDRLGRVMSFVGRTTCGDANKYLPVKNNEFYTKSNGLFLFDVAKRYSEIILVEGHIDALSLHAAGYKNAVAIGGCNLTTAQMLLLQGKRIVLALDNDDAGRKGTMKIILDNTRDTFKVAQYDSSMKDFNDVYCRDKVIKFDTYSDCEYVVDSLSSDKSLDEYAVVEKFYQYLHERYEAVKESDSSLRFGINPLSLSRAINKLNSIYGITIDTQTILNKIYF